MNLKKLMISLAFVLTLFTASAYAKTLEFTINNNTVNVKESHIVTPAHLLAAPYIENDRTMVPVRVISEKLGAQVGWDDVAKQVTVNQNDKKVVLTIGSITASVNGEEVSLDAAPVIKNGVTLVPLRFVSESLGYDVQYVPATKQVIVTNYPHVAVAGETKISYDAFELMHDVYLMSYFGTHTQEEIVQMTEEHLRELYAIYDEAVRFGVTLSETDYEKIASDVLEDLEHAEVEWLTSVYADLSTKMLCVEKFCNYISQLVAQVDIDPEKYYNENYMQVKFIYISKDTENAKSLALEVNGKASRGTDFDVLMEKYSKGYVSEEILKYGYIFTKGDAPEEFEEAAAKLGVGKVSGLLETDTGYYIIKRLELEPYSPAFESSILSKAEELSYNRYINSIADRTMYTQNLSVAELVQILYQ